MPVRSFSVAPAIDSATISFNPRGRVRVSRAVSPWAMLSTEPKWNFPISRKRSYVSRSCQSLSLTRSMERKSGLLLSRFPAWPSIELAKIKVYLKQEMCSMLQPPYFHCVLLVSWKVWDPNHFLSMQLWFLFECITYFIGRVLSGWLNDSKSKKEKHPYFT